MQLTKEVSDKVAEISDKWISAILNIADRCGIERNSFIMHCSKCLMIANVSTDFTNFDISTPESKVIE